MRNDGEPSMTALMAAAARAAHLIVDEEPHIFRDTLAYRLLGERAETLVGFHRAHGTEPVLAGARTAAVTRSRYTEDRLTEAIGRGIGQYVILGAGLDSFAYRSPYAGKIRVFEVDHPDTQGWKRALLTASGIPTPPSLRFVPADLEEQFDRLAYGGLDPSRPAFVSWLGVTMYLTRGAVERTLAWLGRLAPGTELVVEYLLPEALWDAAGREYAEHVRAAAAGFGEPWVTFFAPEEMSALLERHGFEVIEQARQREAIDAALWHRSDSLSACDLSVFAHARVRRDPAAGGGA
ncbi:class I SAM-dependent methyltransferase [Thermobispora bispora]|uniref:S-adenosyl-L-methionine-dependent methyltransferase n=1 Tax=Thermobispora bispora (strain ATCC 19993 / DSM 43833 / CBS 139.67 / JCM 10125 / KCTC 9307 / NBRC 14880 / R51) TaxID=469371 RepID=D6Y4F7_THEBD|nr:class I SAM-dependent methyltransferase [Thermobispora bispora]ADG87211.1 methyltransferase [Thermobispora bispora DSM 43833]